MSVKKISSIQIIGTQRSGSNLLRLMLNQLNEIVAPHPPHILKTFVPLLSSYGDLHIDANFKELIDDICGFVIVNPVRWEGLVLDREYIFNEAQERSIYEIFKLIYQSYAQSRSASYWCCKSMSNVEFAEELELAGITPYYIHLYRDGRDVALSFKKVLVGEKHMYHLAKKWVRDQELSMDIIDKLGRDRVIQIAYEDLIENPSAQIKKICQFVGIDFDRKVLDYHKSKDSVSTAESGEMWSNVKRPILKKNRGKYLRELSKEEILVFESVAGDVLKKLGYPINYAYNGYVQEFSEAQIETFDKLNKEMKHAANQAASLHDLTKRAPQQAVINRVKNKVLSV